MQKTAQDYKVIHDTIHGSIKLQGIFLELLDAPEFQKLHGIRQLGFAYLVFPGANHTRLEHSLGVYQLASRMAQTLKIEPDEFNIVAAAGLLHDIGHGPYSHTLEYIFKNRLGVGHVDITKSIILGELEVQTEGKKIFEILDNFELDAKKITSLITDEVEIQDQEKIIDLPSDPEFEVENNQMFFNPKRYLNHIIHGAFDADQLDYLLRDSHYTGVAHGTIDLDRLMQTIEIFNNDLVVSSRGVNAVEGMLVARGLMYSSVYFHKTVRIAELMLARAVEFVEDDETLQRIANLTDAELMTELSNLGDYQREVADRLKYRNLFKRIYELKISDSEAEDSEISNEILSKFDDPEFRMQKERELCRKASVPEGNIIIDVPFEELKISEPRINMTDIKILDGSKLRPLSKYSPLARALRIRDVPDWKIMVATDEKYRDQVTKVVENKLFD
jgi:HD superfamily phosphohydrolase